MISSPGFYGWEAKMIQKINIMSGTFFKPTKNPGHKDRGYHLKIRYALVTLAA